MPSAGRADRVLTLKLLEEAGLEAETYLLVPTTQATEYRYKVPSTIQVVPLPYDPTLIPPVGQAGLLADARNLWTTQHPPGTRLTWMDDDIQSVRRLDGDKLVPTSLRQVIEDGWRLADQAQVTLWGIYPVNNAFFMRPQPTVGLAYCIGQFYGVVVTGQPEVDRVETWGKEDYERTLRHYLHSGATARLNDVAAHSKVRTGGGGLQVVTDRLEQELDQIRWLQAQFPGMVQIKHRKNGYPEIRLALEKTA